MKKLLFFSAYIFICFSSQAQCLTGISQTGTNNGVISGANAINIPGGTIGFGGNVTATSGSLVSGGGVNITGGAGSAVAGGGVTITGGTNQNLSGVNGTGSSLTVGGASSNNAGGSVNVTGGSGTASNGGVNITGGTGNSVAGGSVSIAGGGDQFKSANATGSLLTVGGAPTFGAGGGVTVTGGSGATSNGSVNITAGGGNAVAGGGISLTGGSSVSGSTAPGASLIVGGATSSSVGGSANLSAGNGSGAGGNVNISSGSGVTNGNITLSTQGNGYMNLIVPTGSVRIGTSTSSYPLTISGSGALTTTGAVSASGLNVANLSNPLVQLSYSTYNLQLGIASCSGCYACGAQVGDGVIRVTGNTNNLLFCIPDNINDGKRYIGFGDCYNNIWMKVYDNKTLSINGQVGIGGAISPTALLTVNGVIHATEIDISTTPSSDYVFEPGYKLKSLTEIESYVKENKHLPEVPSASEFKEKGCKVGQMQDVLLRKIEEITLLLIEQNKSIEELKKENDALKAKVEEISNK